MRKRVIEFIKSVTLLARAILHSEIFFYISYSILILLFLITSIVLLDYNGLIKL